jgi:hypothetical protein
MTKLDWSKAGQATSDPARVSKSDAEFRVVPSTPSCRREFEKAKKARSAAAKRAAKTRKINKEHQEALTKQAKLDALGRKERDAAFFAKVQGNLTAKRQRREAKARDQQSSTGSLGAVLQEALNNPRKK